MWPSNITECVAVDLEGNGGSPPEPVEIAAIVFDRKGAIIDQADWLVRPNTPITKWATRVHGLTDRDVADAPPIGEVKGEIRAFIMRGPIVAHNAGTDVSVLKRVFPDFQPVDVFDTLSISRKVLTGQPSFKLYDLVDALHLLPDAVADDRHRALQDCRACMALFLYLLAQGAGVLGMSSPPAQARLL